MPDQSSLNLSAQSAGPVDCLGRTFPSDDARRETYLKLLAAKLKDPAFRKIEGFPVGTDEAILSLSDPPYYTACPNPWAGDFLKIHGQPYNPKKTYHREPFAADVSEGKNHPIYSAHSYHTKVPHRAIMRYILHYTEPGQVVFDGFCGTGMTGIAAQLCGDKTEVQSLGYRVLDDGTILNDEGKAFSKLGARRAILTDLSPTATFISHNTDAPIDADKFEEQCRAILKKLEGEIGWMFNTRHTDGSLQRIEFMIWSEVFSCPECGAEITFTEQAVDDDTEDVQHTFQCRACGANVTKRSANRILETRIDPATGAPWKRVKFKPFEIHYRAGKKKFKKTPDGEDLSKLDKVEALPLPASVPTNKWPIDTMYHGSRIAPKGFTHTHHFFFARVRQSLGFMWQRVQECSDERLRHALMFFFEQAIWTSSVMNRYQPQGYKQVNKFLPGVYYVPSVSCEVSPWYAIEGRIPRLAKLFRSFGKRKIPSLIGTSSVTQTTLPENSLDYVFTDPPFGENIFYADMNLLVESWYGVSTNTKDEAIIDRHKGKDLGGYQSLMLASFQEYFRVLKPGRWITVEFSNSKAAVWNAIQTTMQEAGFVRTSVMALDKQLRSFRSVTTTTAVKQDLVISAYKPNGGLEERFSKNGATPDGVWDFIRTHLKNLPIFLAKGGQLEPIAERDPRILYDRMVAFYVSHSIQVPLSSAEFQAELSDNFVERDGMWFLPEQVNEYDKKRAQMESVGQLAIFVEDERSAIDWLRNQLKEKPRTNQDIQPDFMQQLNASWKKWEARPELKALLDQNFLCYDGTGEVPSQIHSYLSTQFKELRNLAKDHAQLRQKGKDRWYVPDPKKNVDVETVRNKRLLEEFWSYLPDGYLSAARSPDRNPTLPMQGLASPRPKVPRSKKLKQVRTEAVRVGFKYCYQQKDYPTILAVADMLPESVLNEDEQLQMIYDNAALRAEATT